MKSSNRKMDFKNSYERRLSAIMFTDIVGYTTIVETDENLAITMVTHHKNIINKTVDTFNGNLIEFYGDGSLSIFSSATSAVECAMAIQKKFQGEMNIPLRIGIHISEILIKEGSIYGAGVNHAARIESLGQPGTILFSDHVYQKIKNNKSFKSQPLGKFDFKNVHEPMKIFALSNDGFPVPKIETITGKLKKTVSENQLEKINKKKNNKSKSVAVLPFENYSLNDEQEYFVNGIADEIRSQLLSINGLKVISRSSCMYFKNKTYSLGQIAEELKVEYVLEGRVQVNSNQIKVSAELSNTTTNKQIWSLPSFYQKLEDVFILQNDIAKKVVSELKIALTEKEKDLLNKIPTEDHEAYTYFQKGNDLLHRGFGKIDELSKAEYYFEKAIEIDPKFSRAFVGLSDTYLEYIFWGRTPPNKVLDKALSASLKALELDNSNGECYGALGAINFFKFNKELAVNYLNKAIELSPNYLSAHEKLAWITIFEGDTEKAIYLFDKAQTLDPLSTKYMGDVGHAYYYSHQFEEGIRILSSFLEKHPGDPWLLWMKGYLFSGMGDYENAIQTYLKRPTGKNTNWMLAYSYGKNGMFDKAKEILEMHLEKRKNIHVPAYMIATIFIGIGENEKALDWLELDYEEGGLGLFFWGLKTDPKFNQIRNSIRFQELLNKIK